MTTRKDSDGNPINRDRRRRTIPPFDMNGNVAYESNPLTAWATSAEPLGRHMMLWAERDDGYLKIRRGADSDDLHLAWTWTLGVNRGKYVYVRIEYWRLYAGLEMLNLKVLEVTAGFRKATPDKAVA